MELKIHPLRLKLKKPFTIAHGTFHHREAVVVELQADGLSGFGEATAISYYGKSVEVFKNTLEENRSIIETTFQSPSEYYQYLYPHLKEHPFILCALDAAAHDLWAKRLGVPLYQALGLSIDQLPTSNFTLGIDTIPNMVADIQSLDLPIYKIKLGTADDVAIIENLRQHTDALFRVDANGAWTVEETLQNALAFQSLGVEFIEQPLAQENLKGMKEVFKKSVLPIIADESCQVVTDVKKCHQHFHGINIKLMKCGGITPALQMIREAKQLGMKVMLGCMTETSIGISAIAHLAPLLDYVDMDGAMLLAEDPATGAYLDKGNIVYGTGNGLGALLVS